MYHFISYLLFFVPQPRSAIGPSREQANFSLDSHIRFFVYFGVVWGTNPSPTCIIFIHHHLLVDRESSTVSIGTAAFLELKSDKSYND